ncbi:MAG: PQQ-binding-like beta-propeller repeat protein [Thermoguttaceae bacterium]
MIKNLILNVSLSVFVVNFFAGDFLSHSLQAAEKETWTQFRGTKHNSHCDETDLLQTWQPDGPKLLWKVDTLGNGYSSFSFYGDKLFSMGEKNGKTYIYALDRTSGKGLWSTPVGNAGGNFEGPRCTPATDGKLVFGISQFANLVCVDAESGKIIWEINVADKLGGKVMSDWNFSMSPLLEGDKLVLPIGGDAGTVVAFDKTTGKILWRTSEITDSAAYTSLVPTEIEGVKQYMLLTDKGIYGINPENGSMLWSAPCEGRVAVCSDPVQKDGVVFTSCAYGVGSRAYKVTKAGNKFTAEEIYAQKGWENHHGGIVLVGDAIYFFGNNKRLYCVDLATGNVNWQKSFREKGSLLYADGRLVAREEAAKGTIVLLEANPKEYVENGRFEQPDRTDKNSWTYPVIHDGKMYIRDQNVLLCYDVKKN